MVARPRLIDSCALAGWSSSEGTTSATRPVDAGSKNADAAPYDRFGSLAHGPGKTRAGPEVVSVRVIRFLRVAKCAKVQFPQVGRRFQINDLRRNVRGWPNAYRRIVVIPQAKVQHEPLVHSPIVLDEAAELVEMPGMRRLPALK